MNKKGAQHKVGRRRHTARYALNLAWQDFGDEFKLEHLINEARFYSHNEYSNSFLERQLRQMRQDGIINYEYIRSKKQFRKKPIAKCNCRIPPNYG